MGVNKKIWHVIENLRYDVNPLFQETHLFLCGSKTLAQLLLFGDAPARFIDSFYQFYWSTITVRLCENLPGELIHVENHCSNQTGA